MGQFQQTMNRKLRKGLEGYCDELEQREVTNIHEWMGVLRESIDQRPTGEWSVKVGINMGTLFARQLNYHKVNYAQYDFGGHGESSPIPFVREVPNSTFNNGLWWHVFPATSGYAPLEKALKSMPDFKTFVG